MSGLRIRAVLLTNKKYAVQISSWGLDWSTLNTFDSADEAIGAAKILDAFVKANETVMPTNILWTNHKSKHRLTD